MQTALIKKFSLALLAAPLLAATLLAQPGGEKKKYEFVKTKSVSETYDIARGGTVYLDNQFGDIKINTWGGSQVKLNISVESSANDEAYAQKMLDRMTVTTGKSGADVKARTKLEGDGIKLKKNQTISNSMEINYEVFLPAWAALNIKNQFGDVVVPDYSGQVSIFNQFGDVKAGVLGNVKKMELKYGQAEIKGAHGGSLHFEFANDPVVLQNITGNADITAKFCTGGVYLFAGAGDTEVDVQHSKLNLITGKSFNGRMTINTSHGSFENKSDVSLNETGNSGGYGPRFNNSYESKGSGSGSVTIKSRFTDIVISNQKDPFPKKSKGGKASASAGEDDGDDKDSD